MQVSVGLLKIYKGHTTAKKETEACFSCDNSFCFPKATPGRKKGFRFPDVTLLKAGFYIAGKNKGSCPDASIDPCIQLPRANRYICKKAIAEFKMHNAHISVDG